MKKNKDVCFIVMGGYSALTGLTTLKNISVVNVIYNNPATIVFWSDGTKTVVKCGEGETYDAEKGLLAAIVKRTSGNTGAFNEIYKQFHPKEEKATA